MSDEPTPETSRPDPVDGTPSPTGDDASADADTATGRPVDQPRSRYLSAKTTRRALAAVAVGALLAALITIVFSDGFQSGDELISHPNTGGPMSTGAVAGKAFGTAGVGDCLTWTKDDAGDLSKVDCTDDHLFEVAAEVDLSIFPGTEFGPGSRFPGVLRFSELRDEHCTPAVNAYLGARYDPHGKFSVGLINPGEAGWAAGERTVRCGLQNSGTTGNLQPITGTVANQDQSKVWNGGTCIGINQNVPTDPVDCAEPHAFETISVVDLGAKFPDGFPTVEDQDRYLEETCTQASNEYLGPDGLRNKTLTLFWDNVDLTSWLAGSRKVNCSVGKEIDTGGFASIVNSTKGEILINGAPPVPPPALPEGRSVPTPLPGAAPAPIG
ncbi:septum formation family protein [Rhodococcus kronopolitis]|uniref:Septum formation family protein n=1 Tax=Rhodococcus kronopolitis TaxID=1460226 RepID=A0ABV9FWZ5_9NOCA